jgi:hypothetical protein
VRRTTLRDPKKLPSTNPILTDPPAHPTMSAAEGASTVVIIKRSECRLPMLFGQLGVLAAAA